MNNSKRRLPRKDVGNFEVSATKAEYEEFKRMSNEAGFRHLSKFVKSCIQNNSKSSKKTSAVLKNKQYHKQEILDLINELKRWGNNLNQLARNTNIAIKSECLDIQEIRIYDTLSTIQIGLIDLLNKYDTQN